MSPEPKHSSIGVLVMVMRFTAAAVLVVLGCVVPAVTVDAANPSESHLASMPMSAAQRAEVQLGGQLFSKEFTPAHPMSGRDGLGPLFNAASCAACHHQGGIGGSGDTRYNAKAMGIDRLEIEGIGSTNDIFALVRQFHPMYVSGRQITATVPVPHFGGSSMMDQIRHNVRSTSASRTASEGGDVSPADVRRGGNTPWHWTKTDGDLTVHITSRLYQRNTTPLFGAGLIDRVSAKTIMRVARQQKHHPEVSGRPSQLNQQLIGRFGWRGNRARLRDFVEAACVAELGLQSGSMKQLTDAATPDYQNPGIDISNSEVDAMTRFITFLPRPVQSYRDVSVDRAQVGAKLFASVGCAVCHVPDMDEATGLYSDLLLHDMGSSLFDYDTAEPYVSKFDLTTVAEFESQRSGPPAFPVYYGKQVALLRSITDNASDRRGSQKVIFRAGSSPSGRRVKMGNRDQAGPAGSRGVVIETPRSSVRELKRDVVGDFVVQRRIESTNVAQEWRTPPLWGVADSAPYMHDGRAETLIEAIAMHGGESAGSRQRFRQLTFDQRAAVIDFLKTLRAPPSVH